MHKPEVAGRVVANNLNEKGAGFKVDTNKVTIISQKENKEFDFDVFEKNLQKTS